MCRNAKSSQHQRKIEKKTLKKIKKLKSQQFRSAEVLDQATIDVKVKKIQKKLKKLKKKEKLFTSSTSMGE